jgi:TPP-dependent indolepyruvate ferredoxin oxidoreductase alpha subunit
MEYQKELEALLKALQRMQSRIDYDEEVLCDDCMERKVGGRWEEGGKVREVGGARYMGDQLCQALTHLTHRAPASTTTPLGRSVLLSQSTPSLATSRKRPDWA